MITHIQEAVENREVTHVAFLDTEGAFDSNSFYIIIKVAKQLGYNLSMDWFHSSGLGLSAVGRSIVSIAEPGC